MPSNFPPRATGLVLTILVAVFTAAGCQRSASPRPAPAANPAPPLRLLVIGDSELARVIKRELNARSEGEVTLRELSEEEAVRQELPRSGADAIVFPSSRFGELASRGWLAKIPREALDNAAMEYREIFGAIKKYELQWGEETVAVPLGGPPLVLFYRRDILQKLAVPPPRTWAEYQLLSERLSQRERVREFLPAADATWFGVCEPLEGLWAAQLLLARAAPYCKHRSQYSALFDYRTMEPLIATPSFVRALQELAAAVKSGESAAPHVSPAGALQLLSDGKCALAIGLPTETSRRNLESSSEPPPAIGVAPLPGADDVYNFRSATWQRRDSSESQLVPLVGMMGRVGAMTRDCRQPAAALRVLFWLSGPEVSLLISTASPATAPFRESHLTQIEKWTESVLPDDAAKQYAQVVQQSLSEPNCLVGLRIPGSDEYLQALAKAVRETVAGTVPAEQALLAVETKWKALNAALGIEKQRESYMNSIGLKP